MKVLWFSNTPAAGENYINNNSIGGGWLKSLDNLIQSQVELHVAFYHPYKINKSLLTDYFKKLSVFIYILLIFNKLQNLFSIFKKLPPYQKRDN